jgi:hypothetical protein
LAQAEEVISWRSPADARVLSLEAVGRLLRRAAMKIAAIPPARERAALTSARHPGGLGGNGPGDRSLRSW